MSGVTTILPSALGNATKSICPPPDPVLGLHQPGRLRRLLPAPLRLSDPTDAQRRQVSPSRLSALSLGLHPPASASSEAPQRRHRPPPHPEPGRNPEATTVAPGVLSPIRDSAAAAPDPPHPPHHRPTTGAAPDVGTTAGAQRLRRTGLSQADDLQEGTSGEGWVQRGAGGKAREEPSAGPRGRLSSSGSAQPVETVLCRTVEARETGTRAL